MFSADVKSEVLDSPHLPQLVEALRRWNLDDQIVAKHLCPEAFRVRESVERVRNLLSQYDPDAIEANLRALDEAAGKLGRLRRHLKRLHEAESLLAKRVEDLRAKLTHADSIQRKISDRVFKPWKIDKLVNMVLEPEMKALGFLPRD